jgi:hypothetical protein
MDYLFYLETLALLRKILFTANNNTERMRHLFVDHEGKKELFVEMNTMMAE